MHHELSRSVVNERPSTWVDHGLTNLIAMIFDEGCRWPVGLK